MSELNVPFSIANKMEHEVFVVLIDKHQKTYTIFRWEPGEVGGFHRSLLVDMLLVLTESELKAKEVVRQAAPDCIEGHLTRRR